MCHFLRLVASKFKLNAYKKLHYKYLCVSYILAFLWQTAPFFIASVNYAYKIISDFTDKSMQ